MCKERRGEEIPHVIWKSEPQSLLRGSATPAMEKGDGASALSPKKDISGPPLTDTVLVISHCPVDRNKKIKMDYKHQNNKEQPMEHLNLFEALCPTQRQKLSFRQETCN